MDIVKQNMLMSADLIKVMKIFEENNIEAISFKGPILSFMVYGDIALRQYTDLDILIKKNDINKIIKLFNNYGFTSTNSNEVSVNDFNVISFFTKSGTFLEIHSEVISNNYGIKINTEEMFFTSYKKQLFKNYNINIFDMEENLVYLSIHASKHLYERLSWICDIDRFINNYQDEINWNKVMEISKSLHVERMLLLTLSLSKQLFHTKLNKYILTLIMEDTEICKFKFDFSLDKRTYLDDFFILLKMRSSISDKMRFIFSSLFFPQLEDFKLIKLKGLFKIFYIFIRPLRLFFGEYLFKK